MATEHNIQKDEKSLEMLIALGLTETEALVYLTGRSADTVTVQELCAMTSIKRPTIYHALHTLEEKGLVREQTAGFSMLEPSQLEGWIEQQRKKLAEKAELVRALSRRLAPRTSSAQVVEYRDAKTIHSLFDLACFARSKECVILARSPGLVKLLDPSGAKQAQASARGVHMRIIYKESVDGLVLIYDDVLVAIQDLSHATVCTAPMLSNALRDVLA